MSDVEERGRAALKTIKDTGARWYTPDGEAFEALEVLVDLLTAERDYYKTFHDYLKRRDSDEHQR